MSLGDDRALFELEAALLALLIGVFALAWLMGRLRAPRPGLDLALPVAAAVAARVLAILVTALAGEDIRTTDDRGYFDEAEEASDSTGETAERLWGEPHVAMFAAQIRVLDGPGDSALRVVQGLIAVAGMVLLAAAVYDAAGRRGAIVTAWVVALEPSNVLFSTELHKESLLLLAVGVVALGAVRFWRRRDPAGLAAMCLGGLLAVSVRPYAAGALGVACGLVVAHSLWRGGPGLPRLLRRAGLALGVLVVLAVAASPVYLDHELDRLQNFVESPSPVNNNLDLDPVDLTTYGGLLEAVPTRLFDLLFRPLPWQAENLNQLLGGAATLLAWLIYAAIAVGLYRGGRELLARAGPFLYLGACTAVIYGLTTANAGTGFRHRVHVMVLLAALAGVAASGPAGDALRARMPWLRRLDARPA